jgi:hypothetical protein
MSLVTPAILYCDADDVAVLLSIVGEEDRLDDFNTGIVTVIERGYLQKIIGWATTKVNFACAQLYDLTDMANSPWVNGITTIIACQMLCGRRTNPVPGSIGAMYKEAMQDLLLVRTSAVQIPDIGYRDVAWPAWSAVRVDPMYRLYQNRVERRISERSPTPYTQRIDLIGDAIIELP